MTFTVLNGTQDVGTATTGNVAGGKVTVNYTIPANEPVGSYTIKAVYNGTAEFSTSIDKTHVLTIGAAARPSPQRVGCHRPGLANQRSRRPQNVQPAQPGTAVGLAGTSSTAHKVHRSSSRINRGPLELGPAAAGLHPRPGRRLLVADRAVFEPVVRP